MNYSETLDIYDVTSSLSILIAGSFFIFPLSRFFFGLTGSINSNPKDSPLITT